MPDLTYAERAMSLPGAVGERAATSADDTVPSPKVPDVDGDLAAGTIVNEFRVESRLGQGGMSTVYSAIQPLIGKRAAIKVIRRELCLDPVQVERFVQEARAVNQIGHPNIVDVFAFGTLPDERSYLVMEWLQGETLAERLKRGPLGVTEAMAIIFQICDALAAAHDKGIVHRDLKPENVFLVPVRNRRLLVKLLDFGVAKLRGPRGEARVDHTSPGNTVGTPKYMAPEQARGRDVDYRADVYSLGVTAYEMFTGRVPFLGDEAIDVMHQHVYKMPPAPSLLRADLPLQVERLLLGMLEKKPDKRPTLAQIEARLADVRDAVLAATGESGPIALRALEVGGPRHITAPRQVAVTETIESLRGGPPKAVLILALALVSLSIMAATAKLLLRHRQTELTTTTAPPPAKPAPKTTAELAAEVADVPPPAAAANDEAAIIVAPSADVAAAAADAANWRPATLVVRANAPGAHVELDGRAVGMTGKKVRVAQPGLHQLVVSAPHFRPLKRAMRFDSGAEVQLDLTLDRVGARPAAPAHAAPTPAHPSSRPRNRDDMIDPFASP